MDHKIGTPQPLVVFPALLPLNRVLAREPLRSWEIFQVSHMRESNKVFNAINTQLRTVNAVLSPHFPFEITGKTLRIDTSPVQVST
jgi:hypothetical protein